MKQKTIKLLRLLHEFQRIDHEFPLQYAVCLAEISLDEGLSLTQLSQKTDMALPTVSRIIGALSQHRQSGKPYGLVRVRTSKQERRRKEIYLTAKGKNIMDSLSKLIT